MIVPASGEGDGCGDRLLSVFWPIGKGVVWTVFGAYTALDAFRFVEHWSLKALLEDGADRAGVN